MKYVYQKRGQQYLIRINRGGEIVASLQDFVQQKKIKAGFFVGIGATDQTVLAHYSVEDQKYSEQEFSNALELTNLTGSIAVQDDKPAVHAHATLADSKFKVIAGHLVEAQVSGTCEILLTPLGSEINKKFDQETGLHILDLETKLKSK